MQIGYLAYFDTEQEADDKDLSRTRQWCVWACLFHHWNSALSLHHESSEYLPQVFRHPRMNRAMNSENPRLAFFPASGEGE